tara:strand:- start:11963 stop:12688 length:726 start_codon:yes stop_codon:yes gene_type:complete
MNYNKYFAQAEEEANESYLNYGGYPAVDADFDDYVEAAGGSTQMLNQTGGGMGGAPTSQPYIITISNSTTNAVASNVIGKAFANITATGNGVNTGVDYTMGVSGTTYVEFLYQQLNKPFIVGLTYVDASSQAQALKTLQLKVRDTNGNVQQRTIVPTVDPYQQQNDILAIRQSWRWDGFTSIAVDLNASASATFYFYPSENVNLTRGLAGQSVARGYGNPNVVRQDKVVLGQGVADALQQG